MPATRISADTLHVTLPATLVLANRTDLITAVESSLRPGIRRLRLDASALTHLDTAGLGALARVMRMCEDATGSAPQLTGASREVLEAMRSVLLLRHFDVG